MNLIGVPYNVFQFTVIYAPSGQTGIAQLVPNSNFKFPTTSIVTALYLSATHFFDDDGGQGFPQATGLYIPKAAATSTPSIAVETMSCYLSQAFSVAPNQQVHRISGITWPLRDGLFMNSGDEIGVYALNFTPNDIVYYFSFIIHYVDFQYANNLENQRILNSKLIAK